jgi:hypothetical protein
MSPALAEKLNPAHLPINESTMTLVQTIHDHIHY